VADEVDMLWEVTPAKREGVDVDMTDTLNRSLRERVKRRSQSESPIRETQTRVQHTQDIRSALSKQFGIRHNEERAAKFQGVGSLDRRTLDKSDQSLVSSDTHQLDAAATGLPGLARGNSTGHGARTGENDSNSLDRGREEDYKIEGVLNRTKINSLATLT
jgi:hypothetical protein